MGFETIRTAYMSADEIKLTREAVYNPKFKSDLKCFRDHNGWIPGEFHTFTGEKGAGKSTWAKTILSELAYQDTGVLLYISEERINKYTLVLNDLFRKMGKTPEQAKELLDKIIIVSEIDQDIKTVKDFFHYCSELITQCELQIMVIDNFTTSFLAELPINQQSEVLRGIKSMADKLNIPVISLFHIKKGGRAGELNGDAVRGSGTAINIGSYNYLINQIVDEGRIRNFIFTEKARYHARANKKFYEVEYNPDVGIFTKCKDYYKEDFLELLNGGRKRKTKGF